MRTKLLSSVAIAASMALAIGSAAHATANLVVNGGFENATFNSVFNPTHQNQQFGTADGNFGGQPVNNWTGGSGYQIYFIGGTETSVNAINQWAAPKNYFYSSASAIDGNFVALDGGLGARGSVSQEIHNLVAGKTYTLTFDWAAGQLHDRVGNIWEQLQVSLGGDTQTTGPAVFVPSKGFSGWMTKSLTFTPATSGDALLTFLSVGTPGSLPPMALLDNVSLTTGVPEPATWAMMLVGFGGIGAMIRRRARALAEA
jgi:hypothetical protein